MVVPVIVRMVVAVVPVPDIVAPVPVMAGVSRVVTPKVEKAEAAEEDKPDQPAN